MDEIAKAPENTQATSVQPESGQSLSQTQISQPPVGETPKEHGPIRKMFNVTSWVIFFAFLPVTVLILVSQNTIPGDLFYPIKRGMENVVLAAATVNPATRVAFRTDLTERRFDEAEKLLLARNDTTGLEDFVQGVSLAEQEIAALENEDAKIEVTEKLIKKIDEYQNKLVAIEAKTQEGRTIALSLRTKTPTPTISKKYPDSVSTPVEKQPTVVTPKTSPLSTPTPTDIKSPDVITEEPTATATILEPTLEPTPTKTLSYNPTQVPTPVASVIEEEDEIAKAIDDTQEKLDEIKKQLGEHRGAKPEKEDDKGRSSEVRQDEHDRGHEDKDKDDEEKDKKKGKH